MAEEKKSIYTRLRAAQLELKAPKNETGRFGKSRSAEAILEAAKPVLSRHELTLLITDEISYVEGRHYVKATASVYDDSGSSLASTAHAWEGDVDRGLDTSQVTGKTSSYARKYALSGLLAIDDTKDADREKQPEKTAAPKRPAKPAQAPAPSDDKATPGQKLKIKNLLQKQGVVDEDMKGALIEEFGVNPETMTHEDAERVIEEMS